MHKNPLQVYDTSLRDGAQTHGISYSVNDKLKVCKLLDSFGIDYIEAGWPGSNPKDEQFFTQAENMQLNNSKLVAFGSTRKPSVEVESDPQIASLLAANTPVITIVSKTWKLHVNEVLRTKLDENLLMISDTVTYLKKHNREVILDAEHFFDAFIDDQEYSFECLHAAIGAGVDSVTLCDTNGGSLPAQIIEAVSSTRKHFPDLELGIHCHNDCELAVANSLVAIDSGVTIIQGTINGYGERCGNANLIPLMASLELKTDYSWSKEKQISQLNRLAQDVANIANVPLQLSAAYVGKNSFTHKGGIHVSAINRIAKSYEHIDPKAVGSERVISISELSGRANIESRLQQFEFGSSLDTSALLKTIKKLERQGLSFENADGSFELLALQQLKTYKPHFELLDLKVETNINNHNLSCATAKLKVNGQYFHVVADEHGPVHAIDKVLRKALLPIYPQITNFKLSDYKVTILNPESASAATTRVWIEASSTQEHWSTVGCSDNIVRASCSALVDNYLLFLHKEETPNVDQAS